MDTWETLATAHPGWTLTENKCMTPRERKNWLYRAIRAPLMRGPANG
jgi:hypothetical protein